MEEELCALNPRLQIGIRLARLQRHESERTNRPLKAIPGVLPHAERPRMTLPATGS
jgi:hypothetical protein